jgi:hypothetical protein
MLERMLSKNGFRVYFAIVMPLMAYLIWGLVTDTGIPGWINHAQVQVFGNRYYEKLTFLIILTGVLIVAFPVGFLYDYLTGQGIYSPDSSIRKQRLMISDSGNDDLQRKSGSTGAGT